MSEEKLYAVKDDEGKYWEFGYKRNAFLDLSDVDLPVTIDKDLAFEVARNTGGHVVTLVEEPKKVALTKEQAQIVERAHGCVCPANYIAGNNHSGYESEILLMNALVNGYTVKKDKKYRVITPKSWWASENEPEYMHMNVPNGIENYKGADDDTLFTQKQLDLYGLNGAPFTKEEVTDDEV